MLKNNLFYDCAVHIFDHDDNIVEGSEADRNYNMFYKFGFNNEIYHDGVKYENPGDEDFDFAAYAVDLRLLYIESPETEAPRGSAASRCVLAGACPTSDCVAAQPTARCRNGHGGPSECEARPTVWRDASGVHRWHAPAVHLDRPPRGRGGADGGQTGVGRRLL